METMNNAAQTITVQLNLGIWPYIYMAALLLIVLVAMIGIRRMIQKGANDAAAPAAPAPTAPVAASFAPGAAAGVPQDVVAAIAGALMLMEAPGQKLVVRSIRRTSAWSNAGRRAQMDNY